MSLNKSNEHALPSSSRVKFCFNTCHYLNKDVYNTLMIVLSCSILACIAPLMGLLIASSETLNYFTKKIPNGFFVNIVDSISKSIGNKVLKDKRNFQYIPLMVLLGVWPLAIFLWAVSRYRANGLELWVVFVYHLLRIGPRFRLFAWFHVMAHKEGHDHAGFFLPPFSFLNHRWVTFYCSLFYGAVPNSYRIGHNKIHHRFLNGLEDVHTCYDLDRTEPSSFLIYLPRFGAYWSGISVLWYFLKTKEYKHAWSMAVGMMYYVVIISIAWRLSWEFTLAILIFPHLESIVFFGAISYLWHAFLEADDPNNEYVNSVTILEGHDNIFNEDFHVAHHHAQTMHWTEYPVHFEKNKDKFTKYKATIFRDCEEGLLLYWLFSKKFDIMADHWVDLEGKLNHAQKKELMLRRLRSTLKEE